MLDEWSKTLKASGAGDDSIERVEAGLGWAQAMARKDDEELGNVRMAAKSTASMLKNEVIVRIASALDEERKVSHEALSEECEGQLDSSVLRSRLKLPSEVNDIYFFPFLAFPSIPSHPISLTPSLPPGGCGAA